MSGTVGEWRRHSTICVSRQKTHLCLIGRNVYDWSINPLCCRRSKCITVWSRHTVDCARLTLTLLAFFRFRLSRASAFSIPIAELGHRFSLRFSRPHLPRSSLFTSIFLFLFLRLQNLRAEPRGGVFKSVGTSVTSESDTTHIPPGQGVF